MQFLNYFSVDEIATALICAFFPFGMEFYFMKCTKQHVFGKVNSVTHPDKIMVCWFILAVRRVEMNSVAFTYKTTHGTGNGQMEYSDRIWETAM